MVNRRNTESNHHPRCRPPDDRGDVGFLDQHARRECQDNHIHSSQRNPITPMTILKVHFTKIES